MAVFTPVSDADARQLLTHFDLGELRGLRGIPAGIENTNYFLSTTTGEYVLTLFERLTHAQLPFYIELMNHLASRGLEVPSPQSSHEGERVITVNGKPASIVTRLPGKAQMQPTAAHCAIIGQAQARMHLAAQDFPLVQPNLLGLEWWVRTAETVRPHLSADNARMLDDEVARQQAFARGADYAELPQGPAHCDLFRDNALFTGTPEAPQLGGFIDFYFAGVDTWLFDVAVCINDWCIEHSSGILDAPKAEAFLAAYAGVRPFTAAEKRAWPMLLRGAALRFWLSRLFDFHQPRPAETLTPHDPTHFERILRHRRTDPALLLP